MQQERKKITDQYYEYMQAGGARVDELIALFADNAEYIEPFSPNGPTSHRGKAAIAKCLRQGIQNRPGDFELELQSIDLSATTIQARWKCSSKAFGGNIQGIDRFEIAQGAIQKLTTELIMDAKPDSSR